MIEDVMAGEGVSEYYAKHHGRLPKIACWLNAGAGDEGFTLFALVLLNKLGEAIEQLVKAGESYRVCLLTGKLHGGLDTGGHITISQQTQFWFSDQLKILMGFDLLGKITRFFKAVID